MRTSPRAWSSDSPCAFSSDGIPFLMHDERLTRTTDVASVFPDRVNSHSSNFSWAELKRLNAGAWFLQVRTAFCKGQPRTGALWAEFVH